MTQGAYNYAAYFEHGMTPHEHELAWRDQLNQQIPDAIIDCHVHAAQAGAFDVAKMGAFAWGHMVSTYPETTLEQSSQIDRLMMPEKSVRKLRFAHAFSGIAHAAVNQYLVESSPPADRVALFGLSGSEEEIEYTIEELGSGKYSGLKMYYMSTVPPKAGLYDYFPPAILGQAQKLDVPIILHLPRSVSQSMPELERLVEDFPHLRTVLAHVGVTWSPPNGFDKTMMRVGEMGTVSVDTSGVTDPDVLEVALRHLGPRKVMYGSDEPYGILRECSYEHPELGSRILSDYPYHWVDEGEYETYRDKLPGDIAYSQLQQTDALLTAAKRVAGSAAQEDEILQSVYSGNAADYFGF